MTLKANTAYHHYREDKYLDGKEKSEMSTSSEDSVTLVEEMNCRFDKLSMDTTDIATQDFGEIPQTTSSICCPDDKKSDGDSSRDMTKSLFTSCPEPLTALQWAEPPATSFKVRSSTYLQNKIKDQATSSLFKLLAVDLLEVDKLLHSVCEHPGERMQLALSRDDLPAPFVVAVNICIPGPPFYHFVMYFAVDDPTFSNAPQSFAKLAHEFFFGNSDDKKFRDSTFKLIPKIVEGNIVVKKAVGSKPVIIGRKLNQYYVRNDRFFELVIDVASNSIASAVIKIVKGAASKVVVDLAFVLEGHDTSTLPEQVFGVCRMIHVQFDKLRKISSSPSS